ncbi:SURF1 family protein [mine drainage metagenome]|uniref:SURF1 family protein n=1 Tax=mine drainage metagenome TaxID=410659 RepID=A0A1J5RGL3_9ZZZZ
MKQIEFRILRYVFRPSFIGTILTLICIPLFIKFGLWQYNKAQQKIAIQAAYNQSMVGDSLKFPLNIHTLTVPNADYWNYKKVIVTGVYEPKYQFLLDNQVEGDRVGYHVITPLKIEHSSQYVLINRGWILGKDTHTDLPTFTTPSGLQTITGQIWLPSKKIFTLEDSSAVTLKAGQSIPAVWQNISIDKYQHSVPFTVSPMAIKMDQASMAGGFVRNWQVPAERIATNLGYAYQWFGFAIATLLIYIYMSVAKIKLEP